MTTDMKIGIEFESREQLLIALCEKVFGAPPSFVVGDTDPNRIYYGFGDQIERVRVEAVMNGVREPLLRSVMTERAYELFQKADPLRSVSYFGQYPVADCRFFFHNSKVTTVPGEDVWFQTRCVNLPE